ncbi:MAG: hypothetical protein WKF48_11915 [Solirubrobacteraceae bacterium]
MHGRFPTRLTAPTLLRSVLPLLALVAVAFAPAVASAQTPGEGGYAGTAPTTASGTVVPQGGVAPAQAESAPEGGVAPAQTEGASAPQSVAAPQSAAAPQAAQTSKLPFTGLQIAFMIAAGAGLLGLGLALRRTSAPALPSS